MGDQRKNIAETIADLSFENIVQVLKDYEEFRALGCIGGCLLREVVEKYVKENDITLGTGLMMDRFGLESYRHIALVFYPLDQVGSLGIRV